MISARITPVPMFSTVCVSASLQKTSPSLLLASTTLPFAERDADPGVAQRDRQVRWMRMLADPADDRARPADELEHPHLRVLQDDTVAARFRLCGILGDGVGRREIRE